MRRTPLCAQQDYSRGHRDRHDAVEVVREPFTTENQAPQTGPNYSIEKDSLASNASGAIPLNAAPSAKATTSNGKKLLKELVYKPVHVVMVLDFCLIFLSYYVGIFARWGSFDDFRNSVFSNIEEALIFSAISSLCIFSVGLYHGPYFANVTHVFLRLIASFVLSFFVLAVTLYAFPWLTIWRSALAIAIPCAFLSVMVLRLLFLHLFDFNALKPRMVVLGTGTQAWQLEQLLRDGTGFGFSCMGYVNVEGEAQRVPASRVIADCNSLKEMLTRLDVEAIVVAVDERRGRLPITTLLECKLAGLHIYDYVTFCERETGRVDLDAVRPSWFIFSDGFPGGMVHRVVKRGFDIVVTVLFLVLFLPLMVSTALAIRLEGPGPVFYLQERVGRGGKRFFLYKFRSMVNDAEQEDVPQWAAEKDPRVTTVGALIRKIRIDELPQLVNVLKGDMSFVGPRPERPYFIEELCRELPYYNERHRVKPGITGWAQLNYRYGASKHDAKEKLQYDLYYVKHYSLVLDVITMLQTVRVILSPSEAR